MYVVLSILFYVTIYLHTSPVLKSSKLEFDKYQNIFVRHFAPQSIVSFRQRSLFPLELDIYTKDLQRAKLRKSIRGCSHITSAAGGGGGGMANADHC